MLILGALSGIQEHLFDVAQTGGRQARHLRARSFGIQLVAECAALRVRHALGWAPATELFVGAGRFMLEGDASLASAEPALAVERAEIERWLLAETGGAIRLALGVDAGNGTAQETYERAMWRLQREKLRAWSAVGIESNQWCSAALVLPQLDNPCALCRRRPLETEETDPDTGERWGVCHRCAMERRLGSMLPSARWLVVREHPRSGPGDLEVLGFGISLEEQPSASVSGADVLAVSGFSEHDRPPQGLDSGRFNVRRLARHVPLERGHPVEFLDLAGQARGDALLGMVKMDVDSLGTAFRKEIDGTGGLAAMARFSKEVDGFFAGRLNEELDGAKFASMYTVYAGGDDALFIGPWNVALDFAGHARDRFDAAFRARGLTLSAGIALAKPKRPIRQLAAAAEELLEEAKRMVAPRAEYPKDQCAAFGQVWKWEHHDAICAAGKQIADWVDEGAIQRGWVHTLLELGEGRARGDLMCTSRLAYHVARNWPSRTDREPHRVDARCFADHLIEDLDAGAEVTTRYLPAIARYALAATRSQREGQ
jgi:CRISPR-associated protein Csm1